MTQRHQFWVKNKWWLHINKKRNHAVLHVVWFHISKGSERWKNSTITSVLTENWSIYTTVLLELLRSTTKFQLLSQHLNWTAFPLS